MYCFGSTDVIVPIGDFTYTVENWTRDLKPQEGKVYVKNDLCYITRNDEDNENDEPGIYLKSDGSYYVIEIPEKDEAKYSCDLCKEISADIIMKEMGLLKDALLSVEEMDKIKSSSSRFTPTINDEDDVLKKAVKALILVLGINPSVFKDKTSKEYDLNNIKQALKKKTAMSIKYLNSWLELYHKKITVTIENDEEFEGENLMTELQTPIVIDSKLGVISGLEGLLQDEEIDD